jgi:hypothetical protein
VRGSSPASVLDFCRATGIESVSLQTQDVDLYVQKREGDQMAELVRANFSVLNPGELAPDEIFDAFQTMVIRVMSHVVPAELDKSPDPFARETNEDRQRKEIEDETFMEMDRLQRAAEQASVTQTVDGFWSE